MLKDRYYRLVLGVIAISLAILALNAVVNLFSSPAQAQRPYNTVVIEGPAMDVLLIRDIPFEDIKDIHILGDNQTFLVERDKGFSVYRVSPVPRTK
ncbi:hypothetical protein JW926_17880 [Candidatus Sumerlaeota bacterium]|nr:hypothetical protein [Candidatus Sumerlaeota bacterium]